LAHAAGADVARAISRARATLTCATRRAQATAIDARFVRSNQSVPAKGCWHHAAVCWVQTFRVLVQGRQSAPSHPARGQAQRRPDRSSRASQVNRPRVHGCPLSRKCSAVRYPRFFASDRCEQADRYGLSARTAAMGGSNRRRPPQKSGSFFPILQICTMVRERLDRDSKSRWPSSRPTRTCASSSFRLASTSLDLDTWSRRPGVRWVRFKCQSGASVSRRSDLERTKHNKRNGSSVRAS
jgi:hypothetical protein